MINNGRLLIALVSGLVYSGLAQAANTYSTISSPAAINQGPLSPFAPGTADFYMAGDGTDGAGFLPGVGYSNPFGDLSLAINTGLPLVGGNTGSNYAFLNASAVFNNFTIDSGGVSVTDFTLAGTTRTFNGVSASASVVPRSTQVLRYHADQTMTIDYTFRQDFGSGQYLDIDWQANGGYIRNEAGYADATVTAFGSTNPLAAQYLNDVVQTHLTNKGIDWTHAGIWLVSQDHTLGNTAGTLQAGLLGGRVDGYSIWFSNDEFIFGNPLGDPTPENPVTLGDLNALLLADGNLFPDTAGLQLATDGDVVQVWDIDLIAPDGTPQPLTFEYDESLLPAGFDETMLRIAHFVDGAWETPPGQVVDPSANTISFAITSASPFALTVVPIPPSVYGFGAAMLVLAAVGRRRVRA